MLDRQEPAGGSHFSEMNRIHSLSSKQPQMIKSEVDLVEVLQAANVQRLAGYFAT
jgi:hypothetical protein